MYSNLRIYILLGLFVVLILLVISPDSYTHDLFGRFDSSVFFIYGKAWMEGKIPYTDFIEPKGPFLFLIYGLGYLLSPYNCIGVFWLSCIFYSITYIYTYKTAGIFTNRKKVQFFIAILMSAAWFNPLLHYEIRCEDFAQLFIIIPFYYTCLLLYRGGKNAVFSASFSIGICFSILFLMKFNIAAQLLIFCSYVLYEAYRQKKLYKSVLVMLFGGLVGILPFAVYFQIWGGGAVDSLIRYVSAALGLVGATESDGAFLSHVICNVMRPQPLIVLLVTLFGTIMTGKRNLHTSRYPYFPLISFLFFYLVVIVYGLWYYYYCTCAVFLLFTALWISESFSSFLRDWKHIATCSLIVFFLVTSFHLLRSFVTPGLQNLFFQDNEHRHEYYTYAYLMTQIDHPTWIAFCYADGQDIPSGTIPATLTIGPLNGETSKMRTIRQKAIESKDVDFILVGKYQKELIGTMERLGYYRYQTSTSKNILFSKHQLQMPPSNFHVSNMDILLKRNVFSN